MAINALLYSGLLWCALISFCLLWSDLVCSVSAGSVLRQQVIRGLGFRQGVERRGGPPARTHQRGRAGHISCQRAAAYWLGLTLSYSYIYVTMCITVFLHCCVSAFLLPAWSRRASTLGFIFGRPDRIRFLCLSLY